MSSGYSLSVSFASKLTLENTVVSSRKAVIDRGGLKTWIVDLC